MTTATVDQAKAPLNWVSLIVIGTTNLAALTLVPWYGISQGYSVAAYLWFAFFMIANGMAITAGYHRLWSHRTYNAHWSVRLVLMIFGSMALQNSIMVWASNHRTHHKHVDDNDHDPYSAKRGFWYSHIGWMLRDYASARTDLSNVKDIKADPIAAFQHRFYLPLVLITNIGFPLLAGWASGDLWGTFFLAGVLRLVMSHHITWFINSLAHAWGNQPYTDKNTARDNPVLAFITYGEGYHNFHHLYASDYRNGVRWWQWDPTKWLIASLSFVKLTNNLRRMPEVTIQQARLAMQFQRLEHKLAHRLETQKHRLHIHNPIDVEKLRAQLAHEAEAFRNTLAEWAKVRDAWYSDARERLAKLGEQARREHANFKAHSREVIERLHMQHRRLALMHAQLA